MRIIVTGGAGFIGSHLVDSLVTEGADVHVIDNLSTGRVENVPQGVTMHRLDIRREEIKPLIVGLCPEVIFHEAAQVDVQRSVADPAYDASVNIAGTVNLLEACRLASVKKFIFASSCAVYGDQKTSLIQENTPKLPVSYYGLSKLAGEWYLDLFHRLYGLNYTVLRYANVYGPRQTPKGEAGVVSIFLERLQSGLPLTLFGDGGQTRDFVYVKDVVAANIAAIGKGDLQTLQVSTATPTTIHDLAAELKRIHRADVQSRYEPERQGDIRYSCLDNGLAAAQLEWKPEFRLEDGLTETYNSVMNAAFKKST